MTALSAARHTNQRARGYIATRPMAAALTAYAGGLAMRNAAGDITKGSSALALIGIGRFLETKTNAGAAGAETIRVEEGIFNWVNSGGGAEVTAADIGKVCYAVDDQTVARTSGSGARSPAGIVMDVSAADGVWVLSGEEVLTAWLAGRKRFVPLRLTTIAGAGSPAYRTVSPISGLLTRIRSVIELALTTANATLTASIAGTPVTGGVITVTQAGSAAGDIDEAVPTAARYVNAGDELKIVVTGTQDAAAPANVVFEIDAD